MQLDLVQAFIGLFRNGCAGRSQTSYAGRRLPLSGQERRHEGTERRDISEPARRCQASQETVAGKAETDDAGEKPAGDGTGARAPGFRASGRRCRVVGRDRRPERRTPGQSRSSSGDGRRGWFGSVRSVDQHRTGMTLNRLRLVLNSADFLSRGCFWPAVSVELTFEPFVEYFLCSWSVDNYCNYYKSFVDRYVNLGHSFQFLSSDFI